MILTLIKQLFSLPHLANQLSKCTFQKMLNETTSKNKKAAINNLINQVNEQIAFASI